MLDPHNTTSQASNSWWFTSVAIVLLLVGILLLTEPKKIQDLIIRKVNVYPFRDFVESPGYLIQLRICGVIAVFMSLVAAYAAFAGR